MLLEKILFFLNAYNFGTRSPTLVRRISKWPQEQGLSTSSKSDKNDLKRLGYPTFIRLFKIWFNNPSSVHKMRRWALVRGFKDQAPGSFNRQKCSLYVLSFLGGLFGSWLFQSQLFIKIDQNLICLSINVMKHIVDKWGGNISSIQ